MSEHGTRSRYNAGCRCTACINSERVYAAQRLRSRRAYVEQHGLPASVTHGGSAYVAWGCRCETCTAAHSARKRQRRALSGT